MQAQKLHANAPNYCKPANLHISNGSSPNMEERQSCKYLQNISIEEQANDHLQHVKTLGSHHQIILMQS
jgi:hypothetical protein